MKITKHAEKRMKTRLGSSKNNYEKIAEKAIEFGITHSETSGNLKKYIDGIFLKHHVGSNIRIYQQKVFIFTKEFKLITILPIPANLVKVVNKINDKKKAADFKNDNSKKIV